MAPPPRGVGTTSPHGLPFGDVLLTWVDDLKKRKAEIYDGATQNFVFWFFSGQRIADAAALIFDGLPEWARRPQRVDYPETEGWLHVNPLPDLRSVYLYLCCLAIENLAKGLWFRQQRERGHVCDTGSLPDDIRHHRTTKILMAVGFMVTSAEQDLLALAATVDGLGRFPVGTNAGQDIVLSESIDLTELKAIFEGLFARLSEKLFEGVPSED